MTVSILTSLFPTFSYNFYLILFISKFLSYFLLEFIFKTKLLDVFVEVKGLKSYEFLCG